MSLTSSFKAWFVVLVLVQAPALAASPAESPSPFAGDLGTAIWTLVIFLLVVFVLGKYAWPPILKGLQSREDFITRSIRDAEDANRKAKELLEEYNARLDKARAEATAIVEEGRRDAEVVKRSIHEEAKKEADAMIARAKREISIARESAVRDLYDLGAQLATGVASKIISKEISAADHQRLIQESIDELEKAETVTR